MEKKEQERKKGFLQIMEHLSSQDYYWSKCLYTPRDEIWPSPFMLLFGEKQDRKKGNEIILGTHLVMFINPDNINNTRQLHWTNWQQM